MHQKKYTISQAQRIKGLFSGVLFFLLFPFISQAQNGCTDPQAFNYDAGAINNDGSCVYPFTSFNLMKTTDLPELLKESSGLAWIDEKLYTHSDEGAARLYEINPITGAINNNFAILGGPTNEDWEDLADSEDHVYVGDFGNNSGNRTDLKIYRLDKSDLTGNAGFAEGINFSFSDQTDFDHDPNDHNFDCEAMIFYNDSLHLFSKNWLNNKTKHYVLPAEPGTHQAVLQTSFGTEGLITGADIGDEGVIALLGRSTNGSLFCWLLFDYPSGNIFGGNKRKIFLGDDNVKGQLEGFAFTGGGEAYVSAEEKNNLPARVFSFSTATWTGVPVSTSRPDNYSGQLNVFPNPFTDQVQVQMSEEESSVDFYLYNTLGQIVFYKKGANPNAVLSLGHLPKGIYFLEARKKSLKQISRVVKE